MTVAYPSSLPGPATYGMEPSPQLATTAEDGIGPIDSRRRTRDPGAISSATFRYLKDQYKVFLNWWITDLLYGHRWFTINLPSAGGLTSHTVKFDSKFKAVKRGFRYIEVSCDLEILERRFAPVGVRPPYLFYAPMIGSAVDTISPAATPTLVNNVNFDTDGALIIWDLGTVSPSQIYYNVASKLNATLNTDRYSMLVRVVIDPGWYGPSFSGAYRFFGFSAGPLEVAFSFYASGGTLRVYPWAYNYGVIAGPGEVSTPDMVAPANAEYEIEWTDTDTCKWKVNGVLLYQTSIQRIASGNFYVGNGVFRGGPVPLQARFRDLRVYNGPISGELIV